MLRQPQGDVRAPALVVQPGEVVTQVHAARLLAQQRALEVLRPEREHVEHLVLRLTHDAEAELPR